jgi:transcriptional regulator with XRE-family HTH domain
MRVPTPDDIEAAALAKGLSIGALCRLAGLDASAFWRYRKGRQITVQTLQRMVAAVESSEAEARGEREAAE